MGMSAAHCQRIVREFQSVWRVVTLNIGYCVVSEGANFHQQFEAM